MKKIFTIIFALLSSLIIYGQAPQKMSYQALIRDASNEILTNHTVGIQISILQGSVSGTVVYSEIQTTSSNANGLIRIEIGGETGFDAIDWSAGPYFLKTETDPLGGTNYTISGTSQLLSVPYALHAKVAENGFSGNYSDLSNKPNLFDGLYSSLVGTPALFDGNYNSLENKPILWDSTWESIKNKPILFSGAYSDLTGKPNLFDGTWLSLSGKPATIAGYGITDAFNGTWANLSGKPNFAAIATSGNFNDLNNKPTSTAGYGIIDAITKTGDQTITGNTTFSGSIGITGNAAVGTLSPSQSAAFEINSTSRGFLAPRMSYTQKVAILSPVAGLIIWCNNCGISGELQVYNGTSWTNMIGGSGSVALPNISTTAISAITSTSAISGGNILNDGGAAVTARGVCWSTSPNPTTSNSKSSDGAGTGIFASSIPGLTVDITYYVRAYATNSAGTSYGSQVSFMAKFGIGDSYLGGVLAYYFQPGDQGYIPGESHGLIASTADLTTLPWYNGSYTTIGTTGTAIGSGSANTTAIISSQGNTGNYAAKVCRDYTGGAYADWYLPSLDELAKLYANRAAIGGFNTNFYWSSSEYDNHYGLGVYFFNGTIGSASDKGNYYLVRAVRTF